MPLGKRAVIDLREQPFGDVVAHGLHGNFFEHGDAKRGEVVGSYYNLFEGMTEGEKGLAEPNHRIRITRCVRHPGPPQCW
ncbi:protein of unknown function [Pararobbsia alpina]